MNRRDFVTQSGWALAALLPGAPLAAHRARRGAPSDRLERIGIQLYSLRDAMRQDFEGTLARVGELGYAEVEFAGYFGRTPEQVRAALERAGLTAPATHLPYELLGEQWPNALEAANRTGHGYLIVAWVPEAARRTLDDWKRVAERFNRAGQAATAAGLKFGFHNHDLELRPVEGRRPLDVLLEGTDPAHVVFEMDLYWVVRGGGDPLAYFGAHPGRFPLVHVKDSAGPPEHRMVDVGSGRIDFKAIFARRTQAGIRHAFVEHDQPADPFGFARNSLAYLKRLEF
ncbi:MAG TPA: sugar phosphate isomerase/epimerase [Gemmatimonadales bacterium]|nr:sugar phosphate isomerase/epimerase [Gemmatimonadales bacterium]